MTAFTKIDQDFCMPPFLHTMITNWVMENWDWYGTSKYRKQLNNSFNYKINDVTKYISKTSSPHMNTHTYTYTHNMHTKSLCQTLSCRGVCLGVGKRIW